MTCRASRNLHAKFMSAKPRLGYAAVRDDRSGFYLWDTIRSFNDREAATVILMIVAMVMCIDVVSSRIRRAAI